MNTPLDNQSLLYTGGVGNQNDYEIDPGVCVLPLAEEPPTAEAELQTWSPVVVLRLHAPYRIRRYRTTSRKQNNPPVVAAPGDVGKFVFIGGSLMFGNGQNQSYTLFDWDVRADYLYVENCVSRNQDGFVLGASPWIWSSSKAVYGTVGGSPQTPQVGAISSAGLEPRIGSYMSTKIDFYSPNGWIYNIPSFFPGKLLNDNLANGGGVVPGGTVDGSVV